MNRRVSKLAAAALFTVALSLSVSTASAATIRDRGEDPSIGTRIVVVIKNFLHRFISVPNDGISIPKP